MSKAKAVVHFEDGKALTVVYTELQDNEGPMVSYVLGENRAVTINLDKVLFIEDTILSEADPKIEVINADTLRS